jgi:hypothetical protein
VHLDAPASFSFGRVAQVGPGLRRDPKFRTLRNPDPEPRPGFNYFSGLRLLPRLRGDRYRTWFAPRYPSLLLHFDLRHSSFAILFPRDLHVVTSDVADRPRCSPGWSGTDHSIERSEK